METFLMEDYKKDLEKIYAKYSMDSDGRSGYDNNCTERCCYPEQDEVAEGLDVLAAYLTENFPDIEFYQEYFGIDNYDSIYALVHRVEQARCEHDWRSNGYPSYGSDGKTYEYFQCVKCSKWRQELWNPARQDYA